MKAKFIKDVLEEGVADKYAEREFHVPDLEKEKEELLKRKDKDNKSLFGIITHTFYNEKFRTGAASVYKNPKIKDMEEDVRAILLKNGDLYVATLPAIHYDITKFLFDKDIIKGKFLQWEDMEDMDEFITLQRYRNTNIMALGESYILNRRDKDVRKEQLKKFEPFLEIARKKHPDIRFINENIHRVGNILDKEEDAKYE
jgi:hypothetical protein